MKKFVSRILVEGLVTAATATGLATSVKRTVIDLISEREAVIEENRKKVTRKRISR